MRRARLGTAHRLTSKVRVSSLFQPLRYAPIPMSAGLLEIFVLEFKAFNLRELRQLLTRPDRSSGACGLTPCPEFHCDSQVRQLLSPSSHRQLFSALRKRCRGKRCRVSRVRHGSMAAFRRIVRYPIVAKVLSMGFVVRRCYQCSAGKPYDSALGGGPPSGIVFARKSPC
jgi:hypothetical protein